MRVFDQAPVKHTRALMRGNVRLRMDAKVECVEGVDIVTESTLHIGEEAAQRVGFSPSAAGSMLLDLRKLRSSRLEPYRH